MLTPSCQHSQSLNTCRAQVQVQAANTLRVSTLWYKSKLYQVQINFKTESWIEVGLTLETDIRFHKYSQNESEKKSFSRTTKAWHCWLGVPFYFQISWSMVRVSSSEEMCQNLILARNLPYSPTLLVFDNLKDQRQNNVHNPKFDKFEPNIVKLDPWFKQCFIMFWVIIFEYTHRNRVFVSWMHI